MSDIPTAAQKAFGDIAPALADYTDHVLFGDVWKRPGLSPRDRSLITVASLIALYRTNELPWHLKRAIANGVSREEIVEVVTHLAFYAGWPAASTAVGIVRQVFTELDATNEPPRRRSSFRGHVRGAHRCWRARHPPGRYHHVSGSRICHPLGHHAAGSVPLRPTRPQLARRADQDPLLRRPPFRPASGPQRLGNALYPMVPGHEIVGRVVAGGAHVKKLKSGDLAGVGCVADSCRRCRPREVSLEQYCAEGCTVTYNGHERGSDRLTFGGCSEQLVVDQRFVVKFPDCRDLNSVAPLLCAGITTCSPAAKHHRWRGSFRTEVVPVAWTVWRPRNAWPGLPPRRQFGGDVQPGIATGASFRPSGHAPWTKAALMQRSDTIIAKPGPSPACSAPPSRFGMGGLTVRRGRRPSMRILRNGMPRCEEFAVTNRAAESGG